VRALPTLRPYALDAKNRLRAHARVLVQSALAAGLSWYVARSGLGHARPFFAPIAALISLSAAGARVRQAAALALGIALGTLVADALVLWIGSGAVQVGAVVALTMALAVAVHGNPVLVGQATASAVLVVALPVSTVGARFLDALVGGGIAVGVHLLVLPPNPRVIVRRLVEPVLLGLGDALAELAAALELRDLTRAEDALARLRAVDGFAAELDRTVATARETARFSPRYRRAPADVERYAAAAAPIGYAVRDGRVLARWVIRALDVGDDVPPQAAAALHALGGASRAVADALAGRDNDARELALRAAQLATESVPLGKGLSPPVLAGQLRAAAVDLLAATGMTMAEARRLLRESVGEGPAQPKP
jgi:hypothetical protein